MAVVVDGDVEATVEASRAIACSIVGVALVDLPVMARDNAWWHEMARDAKTIKSEPPDRLALELPLPESSEQTRSADGWRGQPSLS